MKKMLDKPCLAGLNPELPYIKCYGFSCEVYVPEDTPGGRRHVFAGKYNNQNAVLRILEKHRNE